MSNNRSTIQMHCGAWSDGEREHRTPRASSSPVLQGHLRPGKRERTLGSLAKSGGTEPWEGRQHGGGDCPALVEDRPPSTREGCQRPRGTRCSPLRVIEARCPGLRHCRGGHRWPWLAQPLAGAHKPQGTERLLGAATPRSIEARCPGCCLRTREHMGEQ